MAKNGPVIKPKPLASVNANSMPVGGDKSLCGKKFTTSSGATIFQMVDRAQSNPPVESSNVLTECRRCANCR
jgi:hypothetical protein